MLKKNVLERYLDALLQGDRPASRAVIEETLQSGVPVNSVYMDVIWPIMTEIDELYKDNRIDSAQQAFATRINRTIVDQLQNKLPQKPKRCKKIVVSCTSTEKGELGAQMITDLFESDGWEVRFLGSDVSHDDVITFVHSWRPDILLVYGISAKAAPQIRNLIDKIKTINANPNLRVMLSGGVFDRAEGLWEEIGADLYAQTAAEAVRIGSDENTDTYKPTRTINRRKKQRQEKQSQESETAHAVALN